MSLSEDDFADLLGHTLKAYGKTYGTRRMLINALALSAGMLCLPDAKGRELINRTLELWKMEGIKT